MELNLDDIIQSIIEVFAESSVDCDFEDIIDSLMDQGIDLTQFSAEEINEAIDSALAADSIDTSDSSPYHISFGAKHFDGFIDQHETITLKHAGSSRTATFDVYVKAGTNSIYISNGSCYPVKLTGAQVTVGGQRFVVD